MNRSIAFCILLGAINSFSQSRSIHEYTGSQGTVSYHAKVLVDDRDDPIEFAIEFTGRTGNESYRATFCVDGPRIRAVPTCRVGGKHFGFEPSGQLIKITRNNRTATLSGGICVGIPTGGTVVLPRPNVYFKLRRDRPREDLVSLTYVDPQIRKSVQSTQGDLLECQDGLWAW